MGFSCLVNGIIFTIAACVLRCPIHLDRVQIPARPLKIFLLLVVALTDLLSIVLLAERGDVVRGLSLLETDGWICRACQNSDICVRADGENARTYGVGTTDA